MIGGRIAQSGGPELAHELEAKGYDWLRTDFMEENGNGHDSGSEEDDEYGDA
jgi:hypothetical protein